MKKGKNNNILTIPLLHFFIAAIGLCFIIFLPDIDTIEGNYKRVTSILLDIGVCLLPTGLIGLILVFLQNSQKDNEKFNQRLSLLKELDMQLHNFINEICRNITISQQANEKNVQKILIQLRDNNLTLSFNNNFQNYVKLLSTAIINFLSKKDDYLMIEIFNSYEIDALLLLSESINDFISSYETENTALVERNSKKMAIYILKLLKNIPEFSSYLKQVYNGSNIS